MVALVVLSCGLAAQQEPVRQGLTILFVVDGLRPDAITAVDTPNLYRLETEGVFFERSHAVFPTVTRVNAASIGTGALPATHGVTSNRAIVDEGGTRRVVTLADHVEFEALAKAEGWSILTTRTLADRLHDRGVRFAVASSSASASAWIINPRAKQGTGVLVNTGLYNGLIAPASVAEEVSRRFGGGPKSSSRDEQSIASMQWVQTVLRDYVLPEVRPRVVLSWLGEPDFAQHQTSLGSPASIQALRAADREIGLTLEAARRLGHGEDLDVLVTSDHGHADTRCLVDVSGRLSEAGLLTSAAHTRAVDVMEDSQVVHLFVPDRDPVWIRKIVEHLQQSPDTGAILTHAREPARQDRSSGAASPSREAWRGWVEGTFALEYLRVTEAGAGPDVVFTFRATGERNKFGVPGGTCAGAKGAVLSPASGHGGLDSFSIRNTMLAWGRSFRSRAQVQAPTSNVDLVPTLLASLGLRCDDCEGRVITEAFRTPSSAAAAETAAETKARSRTLTVEHGSYRAALDVTELGRWLYVDQARRVDAPSPSTQPASPRR